MSKSKILIGLLQTQVSGRQSLNFSLSLVLILSLISCTSIKKPYFKPSSEVQVEKANWHEIEFEAAMSHAKGFDPERWTKAMQQKAKMPRYKPASIDYDPTAEPLLKLPKQAVGIFLPQKKANGSARVRRCDNPDPKGSFGFVDVSVCVESSEKYLDGTLALPINPISLDSVSFETLRVFYWNESLKRFSLIDASGAGSDKRSNYVWAHITKPGQYVVIGLNTRPDIATTIELFSDLGRRDGLPIGSDLLISRDICKEILCTNEMSGVCEICLNAVGGRSHGFAGSDHFVPEVDIIPPLQLDPSCTYQPKWESFGPANISGVIRQVVIDPANPDRLYAASTDGGIWRIGSVQNYPDVSWRPLTDKLGVIKMTSVTKAISSRVYATSTFGQVFRSDDNGESWISKGAISCGISPCINKIIVVPQDDDHVFIATREEGLRESTDGGNSWQPVTITGLANSATANIYDMILDPDDTKVIYTAVHHEGIFRRDSTGWSKISGGISSGTTTYDWPKIALAVDSSNSNRKIIALKTSLNKICSDGQTHYKPQIFIGKETSPGTYNWYDITPSISGFIGVNDSDSVCPKYDFGGDWLNDQKGWANSIVIDPNDPKTILAGGVRVFRTDDLGTSWVDTGGYHADIQSIVFDQSTSDVVYISTDGGIFRSFDTGKTWNDSQGDLWAIEKIDQEMDNGRNLNRNLITSQIFRAGVSGNTTLTTVDHWPHVGSPDLSTMKWEADIGGSEWGGIYPDPYQDNVYYYLMAQTDGFLWRVNYPPINNRQQLTTFDVYRSLTLDLQGPIGIADDNQTLLIVKEDPSRSFKLMVTHDGNNTRPNWVAAAEGSGTTLISTGNPIAQVVVAPITGKTYAMTLDGSSLWINSNVKDANNDDQWQSISINPPLLPPISDGCNYDGGVREPGGIRHLIVDPENQDILYAVFSGREPECNVIAVSHNGGEYWTRNGWDTIGASLPVSRLNSIHLYHGTLLLGMDTGVYASNDEGASWTAFYPDSLPNVEITQTFDRDGFLYAVTYGRGLWRIKLEEAILGRR